MAKAKITLAAATAIPFDKLVLSQANVRRISNGESIAQLAEDIAHRGLLQSLSVRPLLDGDGKETGRYEVPAGGRRFRALELLVKERRMAKTMPVPCIVRPADAAIGAGEDSLAENTMREALHPLDQFRAFKALSDAGMALDDIAARFFVSVTTVKQRLKLAGVSPVLLASYEADEMSLEHLMAFTVTGDHARQEQVWDRVKPRPNGFMPSAYTIRNTLTEGAVSSGDARAVFVGISEYEAAGGTVLQDLFSDRSEGWFQDAGLLSRLAEQKLATAAEPVIAEGWKWVDVALSFPYGHEAGLTRLPAENRLSEEDDARLNAAIEEYDGLNEEYEPGDELPEDVDARLSELERLIDDLEAHRVVHAPEQVARGGAFVSLDYDGKPLVKRGYARPEDLREPDGEETGHAAAGTAASGNVQRAVFTIGGAGSSATASPAPDAEPEETDRPITEQHRIELTTYRTFALREALAGDPDAAFIAVLHAMVLRVIVNGYKASSCLEVTTHCTPPDRTVQGLSDFAPAQALAARKERWLAQIPTNHAAIWDYLVGLDADSRADLFALCAGLSVNAMHDLYNRRPDAIAPADDLAALVGLDMTQCWQPTAANFFGRVTKTRILAAVREAKGDDTAQLLDSLKKADMAREAERLMAGSGWLPSLMRTPGLDAPEPASGEEPQVASEDAVPDEGQEAPSDQDAEDDVIELPAFLSGVAAE